MSDDEPKANLSPHQQQEQTLRQKVEHPDQEVIDALAEYLLFEHDDPVREFDLLASKDGSLIG